MNQKFFQAYISPDIELVLVQDGFVPDYVRLAEKDFDYLSEWLEWPRFCITEVDFKKFVSESIASFEACESMNCAIKYKEMIAGTAGFNKIDRKLSRAEIGYWIGSEFQKNGIVTEVCRFLIAYAFENLRLNKVQMSVAVENKPSRAVCERLNMDLEGIITNEECIGEKILDHALYAIHSN